MLLYLFLVIALLADCTASPALDMIISRCLIFSRLHVSLMAAHLGLEGAFVVSHIVDKFGSRSYLVAVGEYKSHCG